MQTWEKLSDLLDIDFIHGCIHGPLYEMTIGARPAHLL